jgi:maleate cis-trans isomerase
MDRINRILRINRIAQPRCPNLELDRINRINRIRAKPSLVSGAAAMMWHALRVAGERAPIAGFGRLLALPG